ILSWLFNARMAAVRKTLNNELVADPSVLEISDLNEPNMSGIIRVNKDFYGTGEAKNAIFPLPVQDVTQGHMQDAAVVRDLMETVTGANRMVQGQSNTGRRAATEVQAMSAMAQGRMKLHALGAGHGFSEWGEIMVENTKMFFSQRLQLPIRDPYKDILS